MALTPEIPAPATIKARLDKDVVGQDESTEKLAIISWRHAIQFVAPHTALNYDSRNLFLIGPPGSGKTSLVVGMAQAIDVPYRRVSAPMFASGLSGMDVSHILGLLFDGENTASALQGILHVDQVDQIRLLDGMESDPTTRMAQHNVARLLTRDTIRVKGKVIDTTSLLIVLTCSSEGYEQTLRTPPAEPLLADGDVFPEGEALNLSAVVGAMRRAGQSPADLRRTRIDADDLFHWGFLRELFRDTDIISLRELQPIDLLAILEDSARSPVASFQGLFALYEVTLEVSRSARLALAEAACQQGKSAAALDGMLETLLQPIFLELPRLRGHGITKVVVTKKSLQTRAVDLVRGTPILPPVAACLRRTHTKPDYARENSVSTKTMLKSIRRLKARLCWGQAPESLQAWWDEFEAQNRPEVILNLIERLANRGASLSLFHIAYASAQSTNLEAVIHYLDYLLMRRLPPP